MSFLRYPHLEKFGNSEVQDIEFGIVHIFPKLDGTNASVWYKDFRRFGSRNRELSLPQGDNQGFMLASVNDARQEDYFQSFPEHILYGEWLVPHTIKTYREDAWRKFWIFDVYDKTQERMLPYDEYQPLLEQYKLDYIPCVKIFKNPSYDNLIFEAQNNSNFLLPEGLQGEGIVIKNYDWKNKYNRQVWAKIVRNEFKENLHRTMGPPEQEGRSPASIICDNVVTQHLVDKEYAKIINDNNGTFDKRLIPRLLHEVFYSVVKEELWDQLKKINYASVNFQELRGLTFNKVKQLRKDIF